MQCVSSTYILKFYSRKIKKIIPIAFDKESQGLQLEGTRLLIEFGFDFKAQKSN